MPVEFIRQLAHCMTLSCIFCSLLNAVEIYDSQIILLYNNDDNDKIVNLYVHGEA